MLRIRDLIYGSYVDLCSYSLVCLIMTLSSLARLAIDKACGNRWIFDEAAKTDNTDKAAGKGTIRARCSNESNDMSVRGRVKLTAPISPERDRSSDAV